MTTSAKQRIGQLVTSPTTRTIVQCVTMCALGRVSGGRRLAKVHSKMSCCG